MTSGTRFICPLHCGHGKWTSSTNGRCGSSRRTPLSCSSSASEPITWAGRLGRGGGADHVDVAAVAAPDRQRRAPVALARERPVDVAAQPLAHAPVLDVLGVPVDGLVRGEQVVAVL